MTSDRPPPTPGPRPYAARVEFLLVKTADGWRIDDSDAVPRGY
jgi:hypothetical protein